MTKPSVSVLLPVFNAEHFLKEAINSVLEQTYRDFELIIIDDGSRDGSSAIIKSFHDRRIIFRGHDKNMGIVSTLNEGLNLSRGKYIVRMDADDISLPSRIMMQVRFMETHPKVGICGTWIEVFGANQYIWSPPVSHDEIKVKLFAESALAHPSVCIRRDILQKYSLSYDPTFQYVEDYHLWVKMSRVTKLANIPRVLLKYRIHPSQIGRLQSLTQSKSTEIIKIDLLKELNSNVTRKDLRLHLKAMSWTHSVSWKELRELKGWYSKLYHLNLEKGIYDLKIFNKLLTEHWVASCYLSENLGWRRLIYALTLDVLFLSSIQYVTQIKLQSIRQYISASKKRFNI